MEEKCLASELLCIKTVLLVLNNFFLKFLNQYLVQYTLDLRKPDLRKNLDLRKIVATTDFFST